MQTIETSVPVTQDEKLDLAREIGQAICDAHVPDNQNLDAGEPDPGFADRMELIFLLTKLDKITQRAKKLYAQRDQLEAQIMEKMEVGAQATLPDGRTAEMVDNFADKNLHYGHGPVRRFEVKIGKLKVVKKPACRKGKVR